MDKELPWFLRGKKREKTKIDWEGVYQERRSEVSAFGEGSAKFAKKVFLEHFIL